MSHTKATVLLAGLAMGLGGTAIAQTSSLDEARAFAAETRSDATRATLSQGAAEGPEVFGRLQFAYNVTIIDDPGAGEDFANGFQLRRARLGAKGEAAGIEYYVQGNFDRNGGAFELLDYRLTVPVPGMEDEAEITFGQFKLPFLWEENTSSSRLMGTARSFTNGFFDQGRSQGVMLTYAGNEGDDYRFQAAFSDGFTTANTGFTAPNEADYAFGGRFDYKFSGGWGDFKDFTSTQGQEQALRVGGAIFYQAGDGTIASPGASPVTSSGSPTASASLVPSSSRTTTLTRTSASWPKARTAGARTTKPSPASTTSSPTTTRISRSSPSVTTTTSSAITMPSSRPMSSSSSRR